MAENNGIIKQEFKAEIKQLLDILVHSLYTNQEIFLRELISNASDALDKIRFETTRGTETANPGLPLEVRLSFDREAKVLVVADTGIGMGREEVIANIGTIAHSGTSEFMKRAAEEKGSLDSIIGKFGVGFYSVFMVAREVVIKTKSFRPGEPAVEWRSDGLGTYEIKTLGEDFPRGTRVEVHLKDEALDFADKFRLESIIKKHSNFISFPIFVEEERVNTIAAIWREPKFNLTQEQYNEFYKFLTYDSEDPLETLHISVDAPVQFNSLLFIPKRNQDPLGMNRERPGLDLYVRRVLIQRGNKDLIPEYLGFVRGVVDSEDVPLNISRETLQENMVLHKIANNLTKQILSHLKKTAAEAPEKYAEFWREHGKYFKIGYGDYGNREKYAELLRFNSSHCTEAQGLVSFDQYIDRAKADQKEVYYVFGHSRESIGLNPHMEIFKAKGLEVLYLFEPLDEFAMDSIGTYKDYALKAIEHVEPASLDKFEAVAQEEKAEPLKPEDEKEFGKFLDRLKEVLGDRITTVKVSGRLSSSPACLVNPDGAMTSSMQKILQIVNKDGSIPQKVLEVNRDHRLIRNLFEIFKANPQDDYLTTAVEQLFESSLLLEGYLKDPHAMVSRIQDLLNRSSGWYLAVNRPQQGL
jgi:molecular chaperone HtpG